MATDNDDPYSASSWNSLISGVSRATRKLSPTGFRPTNLQVPMTRDQWPSVYSGHPPSISLRETPKCLSTVN